MIFDPEELQEDGVRNLIAAALKELIDDYIEALHKGDAYNIEYYEKIIRSEWIFGLLDVLDMDVCPESVIEEIRRKHNRHDR